MALPNMTFSGVTFSGGYSITLPPPPSQKAIFGFGSTNGAQTGSVSMTNLVTNTGVVGNDVTGVGTARYALAAASYGYA